MVAKPPTKRGRGRPSIADAPGTAYKVHLPEPVADDLRAAGGGSLSRGIIRQHAGEPPIRTPAQGRATKRARARAAAEGERK
jgi:hypothetical protein